MKKDLKNSYQVRQTLGVFCNSTVQVSGYNCVQALRVTKIVTKTPFKVFGMICTISETNYRFHMKCHAAAKV